MKRRYFIWTPGMSSSNGVRALFALHDFLRQRGYEAFIVAKTPYCSLRKLPIQYHYANDISSFSKTNDIAIYPEVVKGNPLRFQNVVRYVLYYPGILGGTTTFHSSEKVFTWMLNYYDAPRLYIPILDRSLFFDAGLPKTQDCYFINKRKKWKYVPETEGLLEINMKFPKSRLNLAKLLQTTRILYSYDSESALNTEALLCGAQVKIITEDGFMDFTCVYHVDTEVFSRELDYFITETQGMSHTGEIERTYFSLRASFMEVGQRISLPFYRYAVRREQARLTSPSL